MSLRVSYLIIIQETYTALWERKISVKLLIAKNVLLCSFAIFAEANKLAEFCMGKHVD